MRNLTSIMTSIIKTLNVTPEHPWKEYADLIRDGGIVGATSTGFTVMLGDGSREVEFDGGLTDEHFFYFAPLLDEWDKTMLAQAVFQNSLGSKSINNWEGAWGLLRCKYGNQEEEWLPQRIATQGFSSIAEEIEQALLEYRKDHPPARLTTWIFEKPRFDPKSGILYWGSNSWRFRKQPGKPVWDLLCALEERAFPQSIKLDSLDPDQVHEARKVLQARTKPYIIWHAPHTGDLTWETP